MRSVEAVVFDWGGTLTPWHTVDLVAQWYAYAQVYDPERAAPLARTLFDAEDAIWRRQRASAGADGTGHLQHILAAGGVDTTSPRHLAAMTAYLEFWDPHTLTDPEVGPLFEALHSDGLRVGVLSNTMWPREHHERVFERDGVLHLIDAAVYTSETVVGKPHADAFLTAMRAVGVSDPARVVFVGDREWDDVHGAQQAGMRAVWLPHSDIPAVQRVPVDVVPDAVVGTLANVLDVVRAWNATD